MDGDRGYLQSQRPQLRDKCVTRIRARSRDRARSRGRARIRTSSRISAGRWLGGHTSRINAKPQLAVRAGYLWLPGLERAVDQLTRELPATQSAVVVVVVVASIVIPVSGLIVVVVAVFAAVIVVEMVIIVVINIVTEPHTSTSTFAFIPVFSFALAAGGIIKRHRLPANIRTGMSVTSRWCHGGGSGESASG